MAVTKAVLMSSRIMGSALAVHFATDQRLTQDAYVRVAFPH